jgi:Protein of unknown function (DUF3995)
MIAGAAAILILIMLAGLHLYWAAGGKVGKAAAIPTASGRAVLKPRPFGTAIVAFMLLAMAAVLAVHTGRLTPLGFPYGHAVLQIAAWLIAALFALRAIGDFRHVGFFKPIRDSRFARLDTLAYSPLCAGLALLIGVAAIS